ncbi:MAG: VanZ family protein [Bacteroidetes bacterium]|nr:VanZ family protein [Bacteroidota bacterium]
MLNFLKRVNYLPFAISWFLIITVLMCLPGQVLPQEDWLSKIDFDKIVHIGMFAGLVFLWCGSVKKKENIFRSMQQIFVWIALGGCVYGVIMEFVQKYFIPNRSFDIIDMLADAIGSIIGLVVATKLFAKK